MYRLDAVKHQLERNVTYLLPWSVRKRLDQSKSGANLFEIPKSTIAALRKMPGSEGKHGQTAKHRQFCVNGARLGSVQL